MDTNWVSFVYSPAIVLPIPPTPVPGSGGNDCGGTRLKATADCLVGLC